jgi:hypothetical protein
MTKLTTKQKQEIQSLINTAKIAISGIECTKAFSQIEYSPDLTLGDAVSALQYLEWELQQQ